MQSPYSIVYVVKFQYILHSGPEPLELRWIFLNPFNYVFIIIGIFTAAICACICVCGGGCLGVFVSRHFSFFKKWTLLALAFVGLLVCTNFLLKQKTYIDGAFRQSEKPIHGVFTDSQVSAVGKNSVVAVTRPKGKKQGSFIVFDSETMKLTTKVNLDKKARFTPVGLSDGKILFIGTHYSEEKKNEKPVYFQAEIYDPLADKVTSVDDKKSEFVSRFSAIELLDGRVFIAEDFSKNRAFVYDLNTRKLLEVSKLPYALSYVEMSLFANGEVYIKGHNGQFIYNVEANKFREVSTRSISKRNTNSADTYPLGENEIVQVSHRGDAYNLQSPVVAVYNFKTGDTKTTKLDALKKYSRMSTTLLGKEKILFTGGTYPSVLRAKYDAPNHRAYIYDIKTEKLYPIKEKTQSNRDSYKCLTVGLKNGNTVILSNSSFKNDTMVEVFIP